MKALVSSIALALLLSGCAIFCDAPRTDMAIGRGQAANWDKQIAIQNYRYAGQVPEGLGGTMAENVMDVQVRSFVKAPEKNDVMSFGVIPSVENN